MTAFIRKTEHLFLSCFLISKEFFITFSFFIFSTHIRTSVTLLSFFRNVQRGGPYQTVCKFKQSAWPIQMLIQVVKWLYSPVGQFSHQIVLSESLICKKHNSLDRWVSKISLWFSESGLCPSHLAQPEAGLNTATALLLSQMGGLAGVLKPLLNLGCVSGRTPCANKNWTKTFLLENVVWDHAILLLVWISFLSVCTQVC